MIRTGLCSNPREYLLREYRRLGVLMCLIWVASVPLPVRAGISPIIADVDSARAGGPAVPLIRFYQKYISDLRYGRCRFEPSCSQYALEVVEDRGLLIGSALAADRLIRCNASAWKNYSRGSTGRLSDPARGRGPIAPVPVVPEWLLPDLPLTLPVSQPGRIREYARFAEKLAESGDCDRAITEYQRVAFLAPERDVLFWSRVKAGSCHFRVRAWPAAEAELLSGIPLARDGSDRDALRLMVGASRFNSGDYRGCEAILDRCESPLIPRAGDSSPDGLDDSGDGRGRLCEQRLSEKRLLMKGLCACAEGDWNEGVADFRAVPERYPGSSFGEHANYLARCASEGDQVARKSPALASGMSAVVPGLGQAYCGRFMDGLRHLVFDGILIYEVYRLIDHDNYPGAYLMAGIALPFYMGNVVGARRSAERFNRAKRSEFLVSVMEGVE
jgi:putative membrane protein insertion efficiency factor